MAYGTIANFAALHPHAGRLKRAHTRRLRPIRPDHRLEVWYRGELLAIVKLLRGAGEHIAERLRPRWPAVADAMAPGLEGLLEEAAHRFGNIQAVAERLTNVADKLSLVRRGLAAVDERLVKAVHEALGIDISKLLGGASTMTEGLARAARANVALIKSIPPTYFDRVRNVVEKAWAGGKRWEEMAADIQAVGGITERRAKFIARDQTSKINAEFNEIRQTALGIKRYQWSTSRDERVRPSHRLLDGSTQEWANPPIVDGEAANPGEPPNCRCVGIPIVDLGEIPVASATAYQEAA